MASPSAFGVASQTGTAIPETIGRYRLLEKIAKGGMAEVFAARSYGAHGFEKTVALKRILPKFGHDPQFVRMMVDEAKISVLLNHPNIAQILELGEQQGDYFIVLEFVPGQSLSAVVKRLQQEGECLPTLESCFVVVELLQGLHAAHTQRDASGKPAKIIHRDVSPQNTLVSFDGHVKVIDFGIARARDRLEATEVGTIKGKLRYLAPEMIDPGRFHPQGDFDHRVDVFAAGIVLWELIAGRTLFPGDDEMKVYDDITDGVAPDLHKEGRCDAALMKIIAKALERDLSRRYRSAEDFADDLRAYVYRTDPAFTHKRVAATLDRLFSDEKAQLLALERGQTGAIADAEAPRGPLSPASTPVSAAPSSASSSLSSSVSSSRGGPTRGGAGPAGDTRTVRSDNKLPSVSPLQADAATALVGRDAVDPFGELPRQREVTVMTIVSRESVLGSRLAVLLPDSGGHGAFAADDDATVTVGGDTVRAALAGEVDTLRPGAQAASAAGLAARPSSPMLSSSSPPPSPSPSLSGASPSSPSATPSVTPAGAEATAPTRPRLGATALLPTGGPRVGGRLIAASAAVGVALALVIVGAVELLGRRPKAALVAPPLSSSSSPAGVPVELRVTPTDAVVTIDGRRWLPDLVVAPGTPVVVTVSALGHVTHSQTLLPTAGAPLVVTAALAVEPGPTDAGVAAAVVHAGDDAPADAPGVSVTSPTSAVGPTSSPSVRGPAEPSKTTRPASTLAPTKPLAASPRGEGTLLVKASPYWGQVTVDGKVLEEQTPISVRLPAGKHDVAVSHPPRGLVRRFKVTIAPGETVTRAVTFE